MPFGGAGPLFGTLLARELEIREIVVPPYAGNFSAWGLLGADLTQTAARTRIMRLSDDARSPRANELLARAVRRSSSPARTAPRLDTREVALDMRYVGQEHTLTIVRARRRRASSTAPTESATRSLPTTTARSGT